MKIAVVGRSLGSAKWEILFDILEQGKDANVWEYSKFEVDKINKSGFISDAYDCHILCATKPLDDNIRHIRFNISVSEDEILSSMQEFADSLDGEDNGNNDTVLDSPVLDHDIDDSGDPKDDINICPSCDIACPSVIPLKGCNKIDGLEIEIAGENILISYDDAIKMKEMLEIMDKYGYKIKRVILNNDNQ